MLDRTCLAIERIATQASWILMGLLVGIVTVNVFARYGLQMGILWIEEASRLIFVWVVFLGSYLAFRRNSHMAIDLVWNLCSPAARSAMTLVGSLCSLSFLGLIIYGGVLILDVTLEFGHTTPILGLSAAWGYASVPVAAIFMFLELLNSLSRQIRVRREQKI